MRLFKMKLYVFLVHLRLMNLKGLVTLRTRKDHNIQSVILTEYDKDYVVQTYLGTRYPFLLNLHERNPGSIVVVKEIKIVIDNT